MSSCRSQFGATIQKVVLNEFNVSNSEASENKSKIGDLLSEDRFMYADDAKVS